MNFSDCSAKKAGKRLDPPGGFSLLSNATAHAAASPQNKVKTNDPEHEANLTNLKIKKAWDVSLAPLKSIPMNAFMLYMSGNSVQIFSILITVMLFVNAFKTLFGVTMAFEKFDIQSRKQGTDAGLFSFLKDPIFLPKVMFVIAQILTMGLGLYKCGAMGLLPTSHSDWLAFLEPKTALEIVGGGIY